MNWECLKKMLSDEYHAVLHENGLKFSAFILTRDDGICVEGHLNDVDGVITLASVVNGSNECFEEFFPGLAYNFKRALGKTNVKNVQTNLCFVFVFFNDEEKDIAEKAMKLYL